MLNHHRRFPFFNSSFKRQNNNPCISINSILTSSWFNPLKKSLYDDSQKGNLHEEGGAFYWDKNDPEFVKFQFAKPGQSAVGGEANLRDRNRVIDEIKRNSNNILLLTIHTHPFNIYPGTADKLRCGFPNDGFRYKSGDSYIYIDVLGVIIHPDGKGISVYSRVDNNIPESDSRRTKCLNNLV